MPEISLEELRGRVEEYIIMRAFDDKYTVREVKPRLFRRHQGLYVVTRERSWEEALFNMRVAEVLRNRDGSYRVRSRNSQVISESVLNEMITSSPQYT